MTNVRGTDVMGWLYGGTVVGVPHAVERAGEAMLLNPEVADQGGVSTLLYKALVGAGIAAYSLVSGRRLSTAANPNSFKRRNLGNLLGLYGLMVAPETYNFIAGGCDSPESLVSRLAVTGLATAGAVIGTKKLYA